MALFSDVTIEWKGRDYVVPANRVMRLIAVIEDVVTMTELSDYMSNGRLPMGKLSMAYARVLEFAGAISKEKENSLEDEVYAAWFGVGGVEARDSVVMSIQSLLAMMIPPNIVQDQSAPQEASESAGKPQSESSS